MQGHFFFLEKLHVKVVHHCVHQTETTSALVFCDTLKKRASLSQGCKVQVLTNYQATTFTLILYTFKVPSADAVLFYTFTSLVCTISE